MEELRRDEIYNDEIILKRARAALEDLKIQWKYEAKKRGKKKSKK